MSGIPICRSRWCASPRVRSLAHSRHGAGALTRPLLGFKGGWLVFEVIFEVVWIGTMAPPTENIGELKCTSGRTNIDCNDIALPYHESRGP